ncbi:MAG: CBS domain-containing protein, partial [Pseudanabaena sp.]
MFNNLGDLKKLAEEAILIEHFATMNSDLITVQADKPIIEVLALMTANDFDVIPVVEGENWIGFVEKKDISSLASNYGGKCISELQDKLLKP